MIESASFSKIVEFEKCKYRAFLLHDAKIPEPQRPLKPGQTELANDRGTRIHNAAEAFVRGLGPFPIEMKEFEAELHHMRECFKLGIVSLEGEWGMDRDWNPAPWKGAWFRAKVDALVFISKYEAVVVDYKTGALWGNELKHAEQTQLYQLLTFLRYPELEEVHTELWYPDVKELTQVTFSRKNGLNFKNAFNARARAVTDCTVWPPNPNKYSCKFCQYGPWGSGDCKVGVRA